MGQVVFYLIKRTKTDTMQDKILASVLVEKLNKLIEHRGDLPIALTVSDYNGNVACLEFGFKPDSPFWVGQMTNGAFIFHLNFTEYPDHRPGLVKRKK
jgi:hypothetical protein